MENNTNYQTKDIGLVHRYTKDSANQGNRDVSIEKHECSDQGLMWIQTSSKISNASNHRDTENARDLIYFLNADGTHDKNHGDLQWIQSTTEYDHMGKPGSGLVCDR
jgi:hypothetical protein